MADLGHMTKMAATPIYGKKKTLFFFSRTGGSVEMSSIEDADIEDADASIEDADIGIWVTY